MMTHTAPAPAVRLRPIPRTHALGDTQILDIPAGLAWLRAEPYLAIDGYRRVTLFHQGPVTIVLVAFDANGMLPDHAPHGVVTIQAIDGAITVRIAENEYVLEPQQSLVLNPDIRHRVWAPIPSAMLVTVHMVRATAFESSADRPAARIARDEAADHWDG